MKQFSFIRTVLFLLACSACSHINREGNRPAPNIILFLADDMGIGDVSCYQQFTGLPDSLQIHTPTIDEFANKGMLFTDAHSEASLCSPSRWSIMTGVHVWRRPDIGFRLMQLVNRSFLDGEATMPEMLKRGGYRCYGVGKWHMGVTIIDSILTRSPLEHGFDHYTGVRHNHNNGYWRQKFLLHDHQLSHLNNQGQLVKGAGYVPSESLSQTWLNQSRLYLSEHKRGGAYEDSAFFLYYSPHANHEPYLPPETLDGIAVKNRARTLANELALEAIDPLNDSPLFRKLGITSLHRSDMVYENDVALSRLLEWLQETEDPRYKGHKMIDNTLIVLTSDNGSDVRLHGAPPHGHLAGHKNTQFEGGHRIPYMVFWKGKIPEGKICQSPVSQTDLFASLAEVAGIEIKESEAMDSENILPLWLDDPARLAQRKVPVITLGGQAFPSEQPRGEGGKDWLSIRKGPLKLTVQKVNFQSGEAEAVGLYDLGNSIKETPATNMLENQAFRPDLDSLLKDLKSSIKIP
ncbi:MAG: sulfatase-like hydrolase/transferase [Bacteroidetes bacterium]|nr:sulfatase-like hydrolase/transferase [Bacteroidota bacterium]